ncbi:MAG: DsrE family protein, partial [Alphaproteobacteria bacterium]
FGARTQANAPDIAGQVAGLIGKGVDVYIVQEDLADRGLSAGELIDGLTPVSRSDLPGLFDNYDHVWHW